MLSLNVFVSRLIVRQVMTIPDTNAKIERNPFYFVQLG